jgi:arylsulfatase A-like enzyme
MPNCLKPLLQLACLCLGMAAASLSAADARPNVLLILGDDQSWTDFGFMGHPVIQTPHLDRLAAESGAFPRGYVPSSLCRASLATLMTGRYPHEHKISGNDPPQGTDRREMLRHIRSLPTIPKWLVEKGYASLQTGKWWEGNYR